jgi:phosphoglucosamine mutase
MIYQEVSPHVFLAASQPTGTNINEGCGATHMECIQALVRDQQLDLGFSFDGDGDRFLCVDAQGVLYDGDTILAILARYLRKHGQLANDTLVVTKMSNIGHIGSLFAQTGASRERYLSRYKNVQSWHLESTSSRRDSNH